MLRILKLKTTKLTARRRKFLFTLSFCLYIFVGSAQSESTLDKYMKKNTEGNTSAKSQAEVAGINKVYKSPEGYWRLDDSRATGGYCSVTYLTPAYFAGYLGPSGKVKEAFIVFSGPTIPGIKKAKRKKMILTSLNGERQSTQAIHAPSNVHKDMGIIYFQLTGIQAAMDEMDNVEHLTIEMDKKQVFSIKWQGGHTARAAMTKCLGNAQPAGAK